MWCLTSMIGQRHGVTSLMEIISLWRFYRDVNCGTAITISLTVQTQKLGEDCLSRSNVRSGGADVATALYVYEDLFGFIFNT